VGGKLKVNNHSLAVEFGEAMVHRWLWFFDVTSSVANSVLIRVDLPRPDSPAKFHPHR
jgi:hypothetical protein